MTSTTKRGFHLPWGGDDRTPDAASTSSSQATAEPSADTTPKPVTTPRPSVRRAAVDDLGRGPFSLAPAPESAADDDASAGDSLVDHETVARRLPDRKPAPQPAPEPSQGMAWPAVDRAGSPTHLASDAAPPPVRPPLVVAGEPGDGARPSRRDNPLVAGLVLAMRNAAKATRLDSMNRMRASAAARMDEIRTAASPEAIALRKRADDDIVGIRAWSKDEMARVRKETEQRIAGRRALLAREAQTHASEVERAIETVKSAAGAFEADMDRFFEVLLAEDDPARLATLAEQVPDAPEFAAISVTMPTRRAPRAPRAAAPRAAAGRKAPAHAKARPAEVTHADEQVASVAQSPELPAEGPPVDRLSPDVAAAAEAEAIAALEFPDDEPAWQTGALARVLATAPRIDSPDDLSPEERAALLGGDDPAEESEAASETTEASKTAEPAEPVAESAPATPETLPPGPEPLEDMTRLVISGLVSVAGISAFKGAVARVPGVTSVSVTSGANDDIVFSVIHKTAVDLRRAVLGFPAFNADMAIDDGGVVGFVVTEPGAG